MADAAAGHRRGWLRRAIRIAALAAVLLAIWAVGIEPRWVAARRIDHRVPGWQGPPLKVAVASDWHLSPRAAWRVMTPERARHLVEEINAAHPDVVLLPGDFIADRDYETASGEPAEVEIAAILGGLRAPLGVYAVLGNHDWWHGGASFRAALEQRGIRVLENEARQIDAGLWLAGVGDHYTGHSDPARALREVPADRPALVMMHDPASLLDMPPVQGLLVAGHTHGGQVFLPGIGAPMVPGAAPRQWAYGWVQHRGLPAFVTSGLGVSILPLRLNMRPEWLLFVLDAAVG